MLATISGKVLFSNGEEIIIQTSSGVGYQIYYTKIIVEDSIQSVFISHIFKENGQDLFGFTTLQEKKCFELLLSVKGVGPKTAFSIISQLTLDEIYNALEQKNEKAFKQVSGIGAKSAAQIILDLSGKAHKIKMYRPGKISLKDESTSSELPLSSSNNKTIILEETLLACKELGFTAEKILPIAQNLLKERVISKSEQLIHLVLKEL